MKSLAAYREAFSFSAGYFLAPEGDERIGDVSNVVFSNGWIADPDGTVFIYYASSDTRLHVATSTIDKLIDYILNSPADGFASAETVKSITELIDKNKEDALVKTASSLTNKNKK